MIGEKVGHQRSNPQDGKRREQTLFFSLHAGFFSPHSERLSRILQDASTRGVDIRSLALR
jgi:hypothetical protein